ncbi:hypothetical protein K466DRAFT_582454 [Polyporus arcularius HHB13444]|uniref:STB6-like N-terminal domain-containing protein n=1 Tax=Polyporus arcularius HHB13444 TaxID=1314778 RepID=A0A5C3PQS8_9APHY|nr:hypothetical protein K466DRAFT_582454 [Polyporus arcularius HHB13444]
MPPSPTPPSPRPRLAAARAQTYASANTLITNPLNVPSTPYGTPQVSSVNVATVPKRLLMPTVRSPRPSGISPRLPPSTKSSPSKLGRSRAGSISVNVSLDGGERTAVGASDWLVGGERFEVVEEQLELEGFQIYAVEKWVVARKRPVLVLTVYTGDPKHKITVTALSPQSSLSPNDAQSAWEDAIRNLRRDGARPKETEKGILMVTSLANFRSDYTIVHIPSGNFLDVREQLYTNVNLLRMGCGGRSALTLEEPSDATKDRFIAMYHVTDKAPSRSPELFNATVLELVKLIQAALAIFGMFDLSPEERNGLLCDITCEGIQRWVTEIGEPYLHIEPTERVAEPSVIAALFSLILSTRSKLHALGLVVPKDPFVDPGGFVRALATFHSSKSHPHSHSPHILSLPTSPTSQTHSPASAGMSPPPMSSSPSVVFLSQPLIVSIELQYEKSRQSESYKVHRVLKNKLDDLAMDLRTHVAETGGTTATTLSITSDLAAFARCAVTSKDAPQSLRYFWTGRPGHAEKRRREKEAVWSDGERDRDRDDGEKSRDGEKDSASREKDERDRDKETRSGDEGERPQWSDRVQRKVEKWAGFKGKKLSVDFGTLGKAFMPDSPRGPSDRSGQQSMVPSVVVSRDTAEEEDLLSSGRQSPVSDNPNPLMLGVGSLPHAERSASELSEYDRRVTEFNQKRPHTKMQSRIISWSDARSARGMLHENGSKEHRIGASPLSRTDSNSSPAEDASTSVDVDDIDSLRRMHRRRLLTSGPERRRSFDDAPDFVSSHILPVERMRIDVELCGQLLVMRRREAHLANVVACLQALASKLAAQNAKLHADHESARGALSALDSRAGELQKLEVLRTEAETLTQETNALAYESAQFLIEDLWHMAAQPRQRVLALREKVFGTGRRLPQGVRGAHGSFSRVQWTLDGEERLVDRMGRTESEADEEEDLPHLQGLGMDMEDEVDVVEHQNLKPTWLLRVFNYWGGRLGLSRTLEPPTTTAPDAPDKSADSKGESHEQEHQVGGDGIGASSAVGLPTEEGRTQLLQRTCTT